jgi:hypothetical protein
VLEQGRVLLAHDRELEGQRRRQQQAAQRHQQPVAGALLQRVDQQVGQGVAFALRAGQLHERGHRDRVVHREVAVDAPAQLVAHQPVVEAAVHTRALVHQLDALVRVDGLVRHHVAAVCHVGDGAQVVRVVFGAIGGEGLLGGVHAGGNVSGCCRRL